MKTDEAQPNTVHREAMGVLAVLVWSSLVALGGCRPQTESEGRQSPNPAPTATAAMKTAPTASELQVPTFKEFEPYAVVREKLVAQGWIPFKAPDADQCDTGDTRCEGRPEMKSCSGTGAASCVFSWRRGDQRLEVITVGEEEARFSRLEFEGPAAVVAAVNRPRMPDPKESTTTAPGRLSGLLCSDSTRHMQVYWATGNKMVRAAMFLGDGGKPIEFTTTWSRGTWTAQGDNILYKVAATSEEQSSRVMKETMERTATAMRLGRNHPVAESLNLMTQSEVRELVNRPKLQPVPNSYDVVLKGAILNNSDYREVSWLEKGGTLSTRCTTMNQEFLQKDAVTTVASSLLAN